LNYANPWGVLLHDNSNSTAAYAGLGVDNPTAGATTKGGWMMYQVLSAAGAGSMTATLKVQDATTNEDIEFGDLLSSGVINCLTPISGVVALATTATIKRYVRWQLTLGTATEVTFVLAFMRGYI
jgi:hypothetical protein